jgi:hypothetical protein
LRPELEPPSNIAHAVALRFSVIPQREPGGRGRIRTFVARKERQIYSLLVLATHPPVPKKLLGREPRVPNIFFNNLQAPRAKTQKGLVSRDTSPFIFYCRIRSASLPRKISWWSWRRELNPRPSDYKSDALPAELRQRRSNRVRIAKRYKNCKRWVPNFEHVQCQLCGKPGLTRHQLACSYPTCHLYFSTDFGQPEERKQTVPAVPRLGFQPHINFSR